MPESWTPLVHAYLRSRRARRDLAPSSRQGARYILSDLAGRLAAGAVGPRATVVELVEAITAWVDRPRWSTSTRCTNLGIVRPFLDWVAARGEMTPGVSALLPNPRRPRPLPRALTPNQVGELLAVVPDERGRLIVLLEGQCGLRRAEVAGLTMADVDLGDGSIRVCGKGGKWRVVYPSDETLDALGAWLIVRGRSPGALVCHQGRPGRPLTPTWIGILVAGWMADAGLKHRPYDGVSGHALRHATATNMLRAGVNIRVVQEAMGHESIQTTAIYLRADNPEVKAAMRTVSYGSRRLRAVASDSGS